MKKYLTLIMGLILVAFLVICIIIQNKNTTNTDLKKVRLAEVTHSIFYAPQYAAINLGYFEDEGIEIDLSLVPGADKVAAAVLSNDVDIGFAGSEVTIYVYNSGEKDYLKTFAQLTQKDGSFLVSRTKYDKFSLNDLKEKNIIGGRAGGMPEMTFEWALRQNGINPLQDVKIDTSIAFAAMSGAFIGGQGDFVTLFEPQATQIEKQGYGYIVASVGEIGGVVPYTAYFARESYLSNNTNIVKGFTKAIQRGLDFVNTNDSETIAKELISFFPDSSLSELTSSITRYKSNNTWPTTTVFTEESFEHLQEIMVFAGALTKDKQVLFKDLMYEW